MTPIGSTSSNIRRASGFMDPTVRATRSRDRTPRHCGTGWLSAHLTRVRSRDLLRAQDPHAHDVLVPASDPRVLALPTLHHKTRLLIRADRGDVRLDRLKVNPTEIVTHESEL